MTSPHVVISPAVNFGRPTVRGVSTELIADLWWRGENVEDEYGLSRHEVLVALWFEATAGRPRFRRRWKTWAAVACPQVWDARGAGPAVVELPPTASS